MSQSFFLFKAKYRWEFSCTALFAFLLLVSAIASGQGYFGTVSGTLTDPSGAVISGARITLVDQNKGYRFSTTSDTEGRYLYRSVSPGLYTVIAEVAGFEKVERTNIRVSVGETLLPTSRSKSPVRPKRLR